LIRYVASSFAKLETAHVGSVIKFDWKGLENMSDETMEEFAGEFIEMQMLIYKDTEWKDAGITALIHPREMDFGQPFGRAPCIPLYLEEMRSIPELYPSIRETGFYVGGLNWVVDWFITPIVIVALKLWPHRAKRTMGRFLYWGLRTFSKPPFGTRLKVEATGLGKDGEPMESELWRFHMRADTH
jgi:saccharopine dehydrogenase (NAD+, L-lysine-forming)